MELYQRANQAETEYQEWLAWLKRQVGQDQDTTNQTLEKSPTWVNGTFDYQMDDERAETIKPLRLNNFQKLDAKDLLNYFRLLMLSDNMQKLFITLLVKCDSQD